MLERAGDVDSKKGQLSKKREFFFILILVLLAVFGRAYYFKDYIHTDIYPVLQDSDGHSYSIWARDIASGRFLGQKAFMKWPLYAYFLGLLFKLSGNSAPFVYAIQFLLGVMNCLLVYSVAKKFFNEIVGFIAGLLYVSYGLFIFYEGLFIYTTLSLFLNFLFFLFVLRVQNNPSNNKLLAAGALWGICAVTQAGIILFGPLAIIWIFWQRALGLKKFLCGLAIFFIGFACITGTVAAANYFAEKDRVFMVGNLGLNFYLGNNPEANGITYYPTEFTPTQEGVFKDAGIIARASLGKDLKTSEISDFWLKKSISFIKSAPGAYARLLLRKVFYLFYPKEPMHDQEYQHIAGSVRVFKFLPFNLWFVMPFALGGIFLNLKRFREIALLYFALFGISLSVILFFVTSRYRVAIVPFLDIFAAAGLFGIWAMFRQKRYVPVGFSLAALICIYSFFNSGIYQNERTAKQQKDFNDYHSHFNKAWQYSRKPDFHNAIYEMEQALTIKPDHPYTLVSLAGLYYHAHDYKKTEELLKKVIELSPLWQSAYYNLGFLYNRQGRFEEALEMLEKSTDLDPEDIGTRLELGLTYKAKGDARKAGEEFNFVLKNINPWRVREKEIIEKELATLFL